MQHNRTNKKWKTKSPTGCIGGSQWNVRDGRDGFICTVGSQAEARAIAEMQLAAQEE